MAVSTVIVHTLSGTDLPVSSQHCAKGAEVRSEGSGRQHGGGLACRETDRQRTVASTCCPIDSQRSKGQGADWRKKGSSFQIVLADRQRWAGSQNGLHLAQGPHDFLQLTPLPHPRGAAYLLHNALKLNVADLRINKGQKLD
jgi:hypothetical protein